MSEEGQITARVMSQDEYIKTLQKMAEGKDPEIAYIAQITIQRLGDLWDRNNKLGTMVLDLQSPNGRVAILRRELTAMGKAIARKNRRIKNLMLTNEVLQMHPLAKTLIDSPATKEQNEFADAVYRGAPKASGMTINKLRAEAGIAPLPGPKKRPGDYGGE